MPWLVKATPYDPSITGERTLYLSDIGFMSSPADTPADTYWQRRLEYPLQARASMFSGSAIGGRSEVTLGTVTLANDDGALDVFATYDWSGRSIEARWTAKEEPTFADFALIFAGSAERLVPGDLLTIELRDRQVLLDAPYQIAIFQGTGGIEGPAEMKNRRKPRLLGRRERFEPVLINQALLIYIYGVGASGGVLYAHDGGMQLTAGADYADYAALAAATVAPGTYATCNALSLIRLGDQLGSVLTITADGVKVGGSVIRTFGAMLDYIVTTDTEFTSGDFASGTLTAINAAAPQELGHWYDGSGETSVRSVLDFLAQSPLAYYFVNVAGEIEVGLFGEPAAIPDHVFEEGDIFEIEPLPAARRLKRQVVRYGHRARPLAESEVLGNIQGAAREDAKREWAQEEYLSAAVAAEAKIADDETLDSAFVTSPAAQAEAERRVDLSGPARTPFRVVVPLTNGLGIGQTVKIVHPRHGLAAGKSFIVLMVDPDAREQTHTIEVWG